MNYTVQIDSNRNKIVCKDATPRKGYTIVFSGSWTQCQDYRHGVVVSSPQVNPQEQFVVKVVIGGVIFTSIPMDINEADATYDAVRIAAPNCSPAIYEVKA